MGAFASILLVIVVVVALWLYFSKRTCPRFGYKCTAQPTVAPTDATSAPVGAVTLTMPPDMSTLSLAKAISNASSETLAAAVKFYFPSFKAAFLADAKVAPLFTADGQLNTAAWGKDSQLPAFMTACQAAYGDAVVGTWAGYINQPGV